MKWLRDLQSMSSVLLVTLGTIFLSGSAFAMAVGSVTVTGTVPRDTSIGRFDITVVVTSITNTTAASGEDLFKDRLKIFLTKRSTGTAVPVEGAAEDSTIMFRVSKTNFSTKASANGTTQDFTYSLRLSQTTSNTSLRDLLADSGGTAIKVTAKYYEGGVELAKAEDQSIPFSAAVPNAKPSNFRLTSSNQSFVAKWDPVSTVTGTDGSNISVSKVVAVAFSSDAVLPINLPAKAYNSASATDLDAAADECTFNGVVGTSCSVTCKTTTSYLNTDKLAALGKGVYVASADASAGAAKFSGAVNGQVYRVITYYESGLVRNDCQSVTPQLDFSYAETNGEDPASSDMPRCFIATAAYGSPLHKNLKLFTWFRDHVLLRAEMGRKFVHWYYKNGPAAANVVAAHPALALGVRTVLWVPALLISGWLGLVNHDPVTVTVFALALIAGFAFLARRRLARVKLG